MHEIKPDSNRIIPIHEFDVVNRPICIMFNNRLYLLYKIIIPMTDKCTIIRYGIKRTPVGSQNKKSHVSDEIGLFLSMHCSPQEVLQEIAYIGMLVCRIIEFNSCSELQEFVDSQIKE